MADIARRLAELIADWHAAVCRIIRDALPQVDLVHLHGVDFPAYLPPKRSVTPEGSVEDRWMGG